VGFIFDACFSALVMGVVEKPKSSDPASKLLERRTYMALSAAAGLADDVQSMTRFVLAEMDQGAPDETTGLFTFSDLCYRVRKQMLVEVGKKQIPQFGHLPKSEGGDIILAADVGLRLPASLLANLHSDEWYMRLGAVTSLIMFAKSSSELTPLAVQQLEHLRHDPDPRVREAAERYFGEPEAPEPVPVVPPPTPAPRIEVHEPEPAPAPPVPRPVERRHPFEPEMVLIPAGPFLMGSPKSDTLRYGDEPEQFQLDLNYDYAIGRYPVTVGQYRAFMDAGGYANPAYWTQAGWQWRGTCTQPEYWTDKKWTGDPNLPVIGVSWYEAYAYTRWLAEATGRGYRKPHAVDCKSRTVGVA